MRVVAIAHVGVVLSVKQRMQKVRNEGTKSIK